jgi:hypothetical protein
MPVARFRTVAYNKKPVNVVSCRTMHLSRFTPPNPAPAVRGVYDVDPQNPPTAPAGAKAVKIRNAANEVIGYMWVASEHADDAFYAYAWDSLDRCDPVTRASSCLRIVP